jgi:deazaflavin-dependent oxidoreductase (nitroreductase family)
MDNWIKIFTAANAFLFRITKGHLGNRMGGQSVLLLHTVVRKSGKAYTTPLSYYQDGNAYLVVASNWGKEVHSDWYYNLLRNPRTTIQVGAATTPVEAHPARVEFFLLGYLETPQCLIGGEAIEVSNRSVLRRRQRAINVSVYIRVE